MQAPFQRMTSDAGLCFGGGCYDTGLCFWGVGFDVGLCYRCMDYDTGPRFQRRGFRCGSLFQKCGADCVKMQKSSLSDKFTASALRRPYVGRHSWGATYGEHKAHLEISHDHYRELQQHAKQARERFNEIVCKPWRRRMTFQLYRMYRSRGKFLWDCPARL